MFSLTIWQWCLPKAVLLSDSVTPLHFYLFQLGAGIPDEWLFLLETTDSRLTYQIGDVIEYKLSIHVSAVPSDCQVHEMSATP